MCYQDYKGACEAFFDGFKLDPENAEIENALRYPFFFLACMFHMITSRDGSSSGAGRAEASLLPLQQWYPS